MLRDLTLVLAVIGSVGLGGCGSLSGKLRTDAGSLPAPPPAVVSASAAERPADSATDASGSVAAKPEDLSVALADPGDTIREDYDPWEGFNQKVFRFNRQADSYVLKPVARAYDTVMPAPWQLMIDHAFDNLRWPARLMNNLLQGKWTGAGRETARFLINSTAGIGGLFDPAGDFWGIEASKADFGQTLGKWGFVPGPYLILPLLPPFTVRDGIGFGVDTAANPLAYYTPFMWDGLGLRAGDTVNDRSLGIERYQGFEESVVDMYSAVRDAYLRRREQRIRE
jgi:phospholipid-binding lipoprotein MlaA